MNRLPVVLGVWHFSLLHITVEEKILCILFFIFIACFFLLYYFRRDDE